MVEELQEKFQWTNVRNQYAVTIAANLISLTHGFIMGWVSPALQILVSEENTPLLSGPLSNEQISWVGSITCLGGLIGSLSFGYFITRMGSKRSILFLAVPFIAFWLIIYFGNMYYHILIARVIGGWAAGGAPSAILLFTSEIANDDIRGRLGSFLRFLRNTGTLISFILGACVEYKYIPCISVWVPIVFVIIFMTMPNTPRYHLNKGQFQKAEDALKFYKGYKGNNQQEHNAIQNEFDRLKSITAERNSDPKLHLSDFCNRSALKGLGIGIALATMTQFTAAFALISYTVTTFEKLGTHVNPHISSIICAVAQLLGSLTTSYFVDTMGRKILILVSLVGSAVGLFATALFHYLNLIGYDLEMFAWVPIGSLSFVIFISSAGISPLALITSLEYLTPKVQCFDIFVGQQRIYLRNLYIKYFGMYDLRFEHIAVINCLMSLFAFIASKMYPILLETLDLHGCLSIFGAGSVMGFIFVLFVLKETKGKCLDDVGVNKKPENERIQA